MDQEITDRHNANNDLQDAISQEEVFNSEAAKSALNKAGTAKIIVTGGKFWDFDPYDNSAEGEHTNFYAEGYLTTSEEID